MVHFLGTLCFLYAVYQLGAYFESRAFADTHRRQRAHLVRIGVAVVGYCITVYLANS